MALSNESEHLLSSKPDANRALVTEDGIETENETDRHEPQPWARYFARMIDIGLFATLVMIPYEALKVVLPEIPVILINFVSLFLYNFVEATTFSLYGTTAGKWFMKVEVRTFSGDPLSFSRALGRSFTVWIRGLAMGLPFVNLFTMAASYGHLRKRGITDWDRNGKYRVRHGRIGPARISILVIAIAVFVTGLIFGAIMEGTA